MIRTKIVLLFFSLNLIACVTPISEEDLKNIHSIQVLTDIEDKFYVNELGLTAFENESFIGDIADWRLKGKMIDTLKANLPKGVEVVDVKSIDMKTLKSQWTSRINAEIRAQAETAKADTILVISKSGVWNPGGGGFWELPPKRGGFAFHSKKILGKSVLTCVVFSYDLSLFRVSDGDAILARTDSECSNQNKVESTKEFDKYTQEEKAYFRTTLEESIAHRFAENIRRFFKPETPKDPKLNPRANEEEDLRMR